MEKINMRFGLVLLLIIIFIAGCAKAPSTGKAIEISSGIPIIIEDPCDDIDLIREEIASLAEEITNAEEELQGLEIDVEFAREDQAEVADIESLIQDQREYIGELNGMFSELQELIAEC